ncbi:MAG: glycosylase [Acidimicrobiales bacterium]|nr:glycosylase [Acidimicrobiales bacterium]
MDPRRVSERDLARDLAGLDPTDLPMALADLHHEVAVGRMVALTCGPTWEPEHLGIVIGAGGFQVDQLAVTERAVTERAVTERAVTQRAAARGGRIEVSATALRALPDHVGAGMRLLCCGLNPSLHAADAGIGYVTPSNRFWPAMVAAGLSTRPRDVGHLLRHDRVGMTDLVKRPTARADELTADEYRVGFERLARLCAWLRPAAVAVVGLAGWRAAVDRKAVVGWQPRGAGGAPVYVLPSTSGLNARVSLATLAGHLEAAASGRPSTPNG